MIIFGSHELLPYIDTREVIIHNLSSYYQGIQIDLDIIPNYPLSHNGKEFDIAYAEWLINNSKPFIEFYGKIVYPGIFLSSTVLILVHRDESYMDSVTESLQKLIQARYGISTYLINNPEDLSTIDESVITLGRIPQHIHNMDYDMNRYMNITGLDRENDNVW